MIFRVAFVCFYHHLFGIDLSLSPLQAHPRLQLTLLTDPDKCTALKNPLFLVAHIAHGPSQAGSYSVEVQIQSALFGVFPFLFCLLS